MRGKPEKRTSRAAIIGHDEALRESLALLLQTAGLDAVAFGDVESFLAQSSLDEEFVFIDDAQERQAEAFFELRSRGWGGIAVTMTEGLPKRQKASPFGPSCVLIKPFSSNDVLAILAPAPTSSTSRNRSCGM